MTASWKQWEGHVVNGELPLQRYLGGSDHSAVFLTQRRAGEPRQAVLKFVPADLNDSESQILRWRLAMKLPHPNLLRVFDAGRCELAGTGFLYVVMESADEDLSQILPHRALTATETKDILRSALQALAYLHGKGFVHGQFKPSNITAVGNQVKIASDTLCPAGERGSQRSSVYDPPEAAGGKVTPAADVWALGMTLVEMLTQRPAVREGTRQPAIAKAVPEPFREIARHCLQLDPEARWTVAQISERLDPEAPKPQPSIAPVSVPAIPAPKSKRWYIVPFAVAALVLLVVAGSRLGNSGSHAGSSAPVQGGAQQATVPPEPPPAQAETNGTSPAKVAPSGSSPDSGATSSVRSPIAAAALKETTPSSRVSTKSAAHGVIHQVLPEVSRGARSTIQGKVRVSVKVGVDASGNVVRTTLASSGPSKYFARLAEQAAHGWKFVPAQADGQPVASEWMLHFAFARSGTQVTPSPLAR